MQYDFAVHLVPVQRWNVPDLEGYEIDAIETMTGAILPRLIVG